MGSLILWDIVTEFMFAINGINGSIISIFAKHEFFEMAYYFMQKCM